MFKKARVIMTSPIGSINSASASKGASSGSGLSEDTKKKLKALGLDPTKYKSEAEALAAIKEALAKLQQKQAASATPQDEIQEKIFSLAASLNISVSKTEKPEDILAKISSKISEMESSEEKTSKNELSVLKSEYSNLYNEYTKIKSANNMTGADAMANYNKIALGLS